MDDRDRFEECIAAGGVAIFPADTVYGLACDPQRRAAVERLYKLKGRPPDRPAALMFFAVDFALGALPELAPRERAAIEALLPGPLTLLLPNPRRRFPLAGGTDSLGMRVPLLPERLAALRTVKGPIMQSSANVSGAPDARRLDEIPPAIREHVDLVIDGGELPGTASTVLDLRGFEREGRWRIVREGPVKVAEVQRILASC